MEFVAQVRLVPRVVFNLGDGSAAPTSRWAADRRHFVGVGIFGLGLGPTPEHSLHALKQPL
jgi:hypothetical protein